MASETNWYVSFKNISVLYFFIVIGILDVLGILRFKENSFLIKTYPLIVVFLALTLLTSQLGSIARFRFIFYILILSRYIVLSGIQPFDAKLKYISINFLTNNLCYIS